MSTVTADEPLTLFDVAKMLSAPPTIIHDDTPRTRRTDPTTSHQAGDISQRSITTIKAHLLYLMLKNETSNGLTGSELNDLYLFATARLEWDRVHFDSPRKRAGEMVDDGYLQIVGTRPSFGRGQSSQESVYALTDKGRKMVTFGHGVVR